MSEYVSAADIKMDEYSIYLKRISEMINWLNILDNIKVISVKQEHQYSINDSMIFLTELSFGRKHNHQNKIIYRVDRKTSEYGLVFYEYSLIFTVDMYTISDFYRTKSIKFTCTEFTAKEKSIISTLVKMTDRTMILKHEIDQLKAIDFMNVINDIKVRETELKRLYQDILTFETRYKNDYKIEGI